MRTVEVFFAYAHEDELWRGHLDKHLSALRRQKRIATWHDYNITPGTERLAEINTHLSTAQIIVLLISPDFLSSDQCWSLLKRAIKRHNTGAARVIPIIVRPVDWEKTPFAKLQALPRNGNAISLWDNIDEPMAEVAKEIRKIIEIIQKQLSLSSAPETKRMARKSTRHPCKNGTFHFPATPSSPDGKISLNTSIPSYRPGTLHSFHSHQRSAVWVASARHKPPSSMPIAINQSISTSCGFRPTRVKR